MDFKLSEEDLRLRAQMDEAWPPGTVAQLKLNPFGKDLECKTVIVIAHQDEDGLTFDEVLVHDGEAEWWVAPEWLRRLEVASEFRPRMVAHAHATTSPRCSVSEESLWDWLSPGGFSSAGMMEVHLPRSSIAYVIGKGGGKIRRLEEHFGVCIGIYDRTKDEATILVIGPSMHLEFVLFLIRGLAQGASSILTHLPP